MSESPDPIRLVPLPGIPLVAEGDDLAGLLLEAAGRAGVRLAGGHLVVAQKVVSKAEGQVVALCDVEPSDEAVRIAAEDEKDPRHVEVVLRESVRIVRRGHRVLICETRHGFVCANAGVDLSNAPGAEQAVLLPVDPDASAERLRAALVERGAGPLGVVVTDTFGRPWREGQTDVAIGIAGIDPLYSYIGQHDPHGHEFRVQELCVADELAAASELVKGNTSRVPVAVVRGYRWEADDTASMAPVIRDSSRDLFR